MIDLDKFEQIREKSMNIPETKLLLEDALLCKNFGQRPSEFRSITDVEEALAI